jgi:hypothetical protein
MQSARTEEPEKTNSCKSLASACHFLTASDFEGEVKLVKN